MANIDDVMQQLLTVQGAEGAAVVDIGSGMTLASAGTGMVDAALVASASVEIVRGFFQASKDIGMPASLENIVCSYDTETLLIKVLKAGTKA